MKKKKAACRVIKEPRVNSSVLKTPTCRESTDFYSVPAEMVDVSLQEARQR